MRPRRSASFSSGWRCSSPYLDLACADPKDRPGLEHCRASVISAL
jgi:hypothetical protein